VIESTTQQKKKRRSKRPIPDVIVAIPIIVDWRSKRPTTLIETTVFEKEKINLGGGWQKASVFPGQSPHFLTHLRNNNKQNWCGVAIPFPKQERKKDEYTVKKTKTIISMINTHSHG